MKAPWQNVAGSGKGLSWLLSSFGWSWHPNLLQACQGVSNPFHSAVLHPGAPLAPATLPALTLPALEGSSFKAPGARREPTGGEEGAQQEGHSSLWHRRPICLAHCATYWISCSITFVYQWVILPIDHTHRLPHRQDAHLAFSSASCRRHGCAQQLGVSALLGAGGCPAAPGSQTVGYHLLGTFPLAPL